MVRAVLILILLSLLFPIKTIAEGNVAINEFYALGSGDDPDWIELYNLSDTKADIEGWEIRDDTESNKITLGGYVCPKSFRKFTFSNRLNNGGDKIRLFDSGGQLKEEITYFSTDVPSHTQGQSTGRNPDGTGAWTVMTSPTPTDDTSCDQPTPSPDPSPSPTPSPSPSKSPSPTPKNSPSPSPQKSPSPKSSPAVLGSKDDAGPESSDPVSPSPAVAEAKAGTPTDNRAKIAGILTGSGAIIIGASGGVFLWRRKNQVKRNQVP